MLGKFYLPDVVEDSKEVGKVMELPATDTELVELAVVPVVAGVVVPVVVVGVEVEL